MPFDKLSEEELGKIAKFALIESQSGEPDVRIASWRAFKLLTAYQPDPSVLCRDRRVREGGAG